MSDRKNDEEEEETRRKKFLMWHLNFLHASTDPDRANGYSLRDSKALNVFVTKLSFSCNLLFTGDM